MRLFRHWRTSCRTAVAFPWFWCRDADFKTWLLIHFTNQIQTKCHFWHFANSLEDWWPFGIIITCISYHLKISWQDGSRRLQLCVTRENQQTLFLCYYYYYYVHLTAFFRTTRVSRHQKGKRFWILLEQEMMGWQWHQLDCMQIICTSLRADNHVSTTPLSFYRPAALPAAQPTASKHWRHLAR